MAYGLTPVRHVRGGVIRMNNFMRYTIASAYATDLYVGDPVKLVAGGTIERAAAGDSLVGVFAGVQYKDTVSGEFKYAQRWPASTAASEITAMVWDDPDVLYRAEADQDTTALVFADIGLNVDIVVAAGSDVTNRSGSSVDSNTEAVTNTIVLRFLGSAEDDEAFTAVGTPMDVYVMINLHMHRDTTGV